MGLVVKPNTFSASTTARSSEVNANFDTLYTLVNGNLEEANLANGAVTENKLAASAVTNAKVSASAAIALSKLAALTADIVPVADASGFLTSSAVTSTELGYVSGVTSAIQTQLTAAQGAADTAQSEIDSHEALTNNPHNVTPAHLGIYGGHVALDGTAESLPGGWSSIRDSTGNYTITHNLGLADIDNGLSVVVSVSNTGIGGSIATFSPLDADSFIIRIRDGSGTAKNNNFRFIGIT